MRAHFLALGFVLGFLGLPALAAAPEAAVPYDLTFAGTFSVTPFSAANHNSELRFQGAGAGEPHGAWNIHGYSQMSPGPDGCTPILADDVTLRVAESTLHMVNEGRDCFDLASRPGHVLVVGSGTTTFTGGTGDFGGATGKGTWTVVAEVKGPLLDLPAGVQGTFGPLHFAGTLQVP